MFEQLKSFQPSEKGREFISLLFPLAHSDRESKLLEYWKQYPQEKQALLDGFHYLIQEIIEARNAGLNDDIIGLSPELLSIIIGEMINSKYYFSYDSTDLFFEAVNQITPPVFSDFKQIKQIIVDQSKPKSEAAPKGQFNLPTTFDETIDKKFREICGAAEKAYDNLSRIHRSLINSQKMVESYKISKSDISLFEVKLAKETFLENKKFFLDNGKIIAEGMAYVYEVYQKYPDELLVKKSYIKYLAKLLASREARYPTEAYVGNLAKGDFDFGLPDFDPTDLQLQHGKTKYSLKKVYKVKLLKDIYRLEARYRKRKLTALLKKDTPKSKIIGELQEILKLDPIDIKTHIFIARLLAEYSSSLSNHAKRGVLREQALKHCQAAFSKIDDYLDLQAIREMKERDVTRSGFVKTISAIRIPLIRRG
jgi:hypothetical protein